MAWECDRCGTVHTQNSDQCRNCGHNIFSPVSDRELTARSDSDVSPEPTDVGSDRVMGTTADPEYERSPDVAVDGSLAEGSSTRDDSTDRKPTPSTGRVRSVYHALRGLVRAPFGLLRRYLLPILAFVLVFGVVAFLFL